MRADFPHSLRLILADLYFSTSFLITERKTQKKIHQKWEAIRFPSPESDGKFSFCSSCQNYFLMKFPPSLGRILRGKIKAKSFRLVPVERFQILSRIETVVTWAELGCDWNLAEVCWAGLGLGNLLASHKTSTLGGEMWVENVNLIGIWRPCDKPQLYGCALRSKL